jgi:molybdenum cofactor cytidylyltransferase
LDNPDFAQGLSTSLRVGLNALPSDLDAVLIMLADMPLITARDIDQMFAAFDQEEGRKIVVATANGKRGNPVLFDMSYRAELCAIEGDKGARQLIIAHGAEVVEVEIGRGALVDLDTPEALQDFRTGARP